MANDETPWTSNIVWLRPDGTVAITHCAPGTDLAAWRDELMARGDHPEGSTAVALDAEVPPRSEFRNALTFRNGKLDHDMPRATALRREQLRRERAPVLAALDVEYQRADEKGDAAAKKAVAAKKQALRDITDHPGLASAKTLDDLRAVKLP